MPHGSFYRAPLLGRLFLESISIINYGPGRHTSPCSVEHTCHGDLGKLITVLKNSNYVASFVNQDVEVFSRSVL